MYCSEIDALPSVGHACGHHLIAISGVAAAIATAEALKKTNTAGTVVLLGTPAEEVCSVEGGGKPKMLHLGAWKDADASIMCHPAPATVSAFTSTAVASCKVEFYGAPAHAAASPWEGKEHTGRADPGSHCDWPPSATTAAV